MRDIMRDIRFRAWNKETKEMNYDVQRCKDCDSGECFGHYFYKDYILMQYTGLHDKNGKEIYEGDIVKIETIVMGEWKDDGNEEVIWWRGGFCRGLKDKCGLPFWWLNKDTQRFEVIGNIYENSELLTERD